MYKHVFHALAAQHNRLLQQVLPVWRATACNLLKQITPRDTHNLQVCDCSNNVSTAAQQGSLQERSSIMQ
jgi:hypothetical protein